MTYIRKTEDEYQVLGYTSYGWELMTAAKTRKEAVQHLKEYRENQPEFSYKIKKVRVPKTV